jgi:hypothetical protein
MSAINGYAAFHSRFHASTRHFIDSLKKRNMACEHACAAKAFLNVRFYQDAAVVTEEECAFVLDPAGESGGRVWVTTDLPDQAHPDDGLLASQISDTYIGIASACLEKGLDRLYSQLSRGPANTHLYVTGHCTLPFWFYLARRIMARGAFGALKFIAVPFRWRTARSLRYSDAVRV